MPKCDHCGEQCDLPFHCSYCGGSYCSDHRLPPSHTCINEEGWRNRTAARTGSHTGPGEENRSLPEKECFYCGVMTAKSYYCPECGQDFCSFHKRHVDHHPPEHKRPYNQPVYDRPPVPVDSQEDSPQDIPRKPLDPRIIAVFLVLFALIIGAVLAVSMFHSPAEIPASNTPPVTPEQTGTPASEPPSGTAPTTMSDNKPATGTIISGYALSQGDGKLFVDNVLGEQDAVVVLTRSGSSYSLIGVYIGSGENYTIEKIGDGSYNLFIHSGKKWNSAGKKFDENPHYRMFLEPVTYTTLTTTMTILFEKRTETRYSTWNVTLYSVAEGNAKTVGIPENSFPGLS